MSCQNIKYVVNMKSKCQSTQHIKISTVKSPLFSEGIPEDQSKQQFSHSHVDDLPHPSKIKGEKVLACLSVLVCIFSTHQVGKAVSIVFEVSSIRSPPLIHVLISYPPLTHVIIN